VQFGEVSIDDALVAENMKTKENVVVKDNGCVCCTVRGDLIRALADIHKKGPFDAVLLETTGLADPAPVWKNDTLILNSLCTFGAYRRFMRRCVLWYRWRCRSSSRRW
jgi:G3E family GTPase